VSILRHFETNSLMVKQLNLTFRDQSYQDDYAVMTYYLYLIIYGFVYHAMRHIFSANQHTKNKYLKKSKFEILCWLERYRVIINIFQSVIWAVGVVVSATRSRSHYLGSTLGLLKHFSMISLQQHFWSLIFYIFSIHLDISCAKKPR
jgi:hypothetical protein